ncbi:MAG: GNAT family N-acetyltransferase [Acidobacteria bacterium]|nr:GNAT family N-acetyltransferase [Acidobacteriota bacterium]
MRSVAPLHLPVEDDRTGRVVLRDGTVAAIRPADAADAEALTAFLSGFHDPALLARFSRAAGLRPEPDGRPPDQAFTLVARRTVAHAPAIIGVGSYVRLSDASAEVAFAVDEAAQGLGLATALLERLIVDAARHGIHVFRAAVPPQNLAMLDVFRQSGFEQRAVAEPDRVLVELTLVPTAAAVWAAEERERVATSASMRRVLCPRSVAVIGVSRSPSSIGRRVFDAIVRGGFKGSTYPIARSADAVAGMRAHTSIGDIGAPVDVAIIAVPYTSVPSVVDECAAAGVKGLVVISAGFAEAGAEGRRRQAALLDQVRGYGMRMVGPNCMGIMNARPDVSLNASFSPLFPPAGRLALLSQSGALGVIVLALAAERQLGLSTFVSVGNKADISGNDLLQYWEADPETSVIALYLESFGNPQRFGRIARRVSRRKPIVAVKAGRTLAGSRAAGSHTAALAANDAAVTALFRQTGVIRAETTDDLLDIATCLEAQPLPAGPRVGIVTNAGGPGILAADACTAAGLTVPELGAATREVFRAFLPPEAGISNPVDMIATAGADEYRRAVETMLTSPDVDALLVLYTSLDESSMPAVLAAIEAGVIEARSKEGAARPVVACVMAAGPKPALRAGDERIPLYVFPENAARALGKVAAYAAWRQAPPGVFWDYPDLDRQTARAVCRDAAAGRGAGWLSQDEMRTVARAAGIPMIATVLAHTAEEARAQAVTLGLPLVAKMSAVGVVHKTEVGGVITNLASVEDVATAFETLAGRARAHGLQFEGVVLQPMIEQGVETIVGMIRDPLFGPLVGFGLGGTSVEVLGDVQFRLSPLTDRDVASLVDETRAGRLLAGYRGRPAADRAAVEELVARVSLLAEAVPEIAELDLNPVLVLPDGQGCRVVDARIRVAAVAGA